MADGEKSEIEARKCSSSKRIRLSGAGYKAQRLKRAKEDAKQRMALKHFFNNTSVAGIVLRYF
jgi:hypothetical protein